MRICILQTLHTPFDKRVFHKEAKSLVAGAHEVISIAPCDEPVPETVGGVHFETYPVARTLWQRFVAALKLVARGRRVKADVYLSVEPESWFSGVLIKLLTGRRVVLDVHEYYPTEFAKFFPKWMSGFVAWLTLRVMRVFARMADHVILTKECLDRDFAGLKVPRTVVLNTNHLQPPCTDIPPELARRYAGCPTLIHQGQFGEKRGSLELLEAMKILVGKIPDVQCMILGEFVDGSEERYRTAIQEAGLDHAVHILGTVPFEEVPAYIAVSKVGLILFQPTVFGHKFGMPHKMFDYMREAIPLIAPDFVIEIARIVREADCGILVDVTKPEAIADAVVHLLASPGEAERLGKNGRRILEAKYNWGYDEKRLLGVFESVMRT